MRDCLKGLFCVCVCGTGISSFLWRFVPAMTVDRVAAAVAVVVLLLVILDLIVVIVGVVFMSLIFFWGGHPFYYSIQATCSSTKGL